MDILGLSVERGEKRADDRISGTTCWGGRKTNQNRKQKSSQRRKRREHKVRQVNGQEGFKKEDMMLNGAQGMRKTMS